MNDMIETKQTTRMLRVSYSEKEKIVLGEQLGNTLRDLAQAESELKSIQARYSGKIKEHKAKIQTLAEEINTGWKMKEVECEEMRDYSVGTYYLYRLDGTERVLVEERALTGEERQMGLFEKKKEEEGAEAPAGGGGGEDSAGEVKGQPEAEPGVEGAGATPEPSSPDESASLFEEEGKEEEDAD